MGKSTVSLVALFAIVCVVFARVHAAEELLVWNYTSPNTWPDVYCNDGMNQSPIDIITTEVEENSDELVALQLIGYDVDVVGVLENKGGHTLEFSPGADAPTAQLINHRGTYNLLQFHVHWPGSEHVFNGQRHNAEIHFVHRREGGASPDSDGSDEYSVLAVFCQVTNDDVIPGSLWDTILSVLPKEVDKKETMPPFSYDILLPDVPLDELDYFFYPGSLTTPQCNEVVQWFLLKKTLQIPSKVIKEMQSLYANDDGDLLEFNFRPPQPLNNRTVRGFTAASSAQQTLVTMELLLSLCMLVVSMAAL